MVLATKKTTGVASSLGMPTAEALVHFGGLGSFRFMTAEGTKAACPLLLFGKAFESSAGKRTRVTLANFTTHIP
jgi:hypothetical protein